VRMLVNTKMLLAIMAIISLTPLAIAVFRSNVSGTVPAEGYKILGEWDGVTYSEYTIYYSPIDVIIALVIVDTYIDQSDVTLYLPTAGGYIHASHVPSLYACIERAVLVNDNDISVSYSGTLYVETVYDP